jgi:hypothetical protein
MAKLVPVDSEAIEAVGFEAGELVVKYRSGGTYVYSAVPERLYRRFMRADSLGAFMNREIKPHYECRQL